ncbi:hypothetical protein CDAR_557061 [Caerostris darwini]|uniref:Uncharacterized protein n=1 Tax=Caerostris darwini TaxID=1538125 RepID=A0AAV4TZW2_9ARAC|nr:hypothetical protein CDAR_557061 [Caerostris darwini]
MFLSKSSLILHRALHFFIQQFNNATLHIHHLEYRFSQYEDSLTPAFRQPQHYLSICAKIFSARKQTASFSPLEILRQRLLQAAHAGNENGPNSGEKCHKFVKPQMRKNEASRQCSSDTLFGVDSTRPAYSDGSKGGFWAERERAKNVGMGHDE